MLPARWCLRVAATELTIITQVEVATAICIADWPIASWAPCAAVSTPYSTGTTTKPPPNPNSTVVTPLNAPNRARTR
ncbi:hypothetical protein D3C72_1777700 [compost metagenome]